MSSQYQKVFVRTLGSQFRASAVLQKIPSAIKHSSNMSAKGSLNLPRGSWDSHVHVVDEDAFPFPPDHLYRPKKADLNNLLRFEGDLGVDHVCIVALSVYGNDNGLLLHSLRKLEGKGRGVVSIDPRTVSDDELDEMHAVGVRGVRVNLKSASKTLDKEDFVATLGLLADKIRRLKWAIQLYLALADMAKIGDLIPKLGVPLVIDHLGEPEKSTPPRTQPGYSELMDLLRKRQVWVKLSGTYRFPELPELDEYIMEILKVAPTQVTWASDWPHTGGSKNNPGGDRKKSQEFVRVDDREFIMKCRQWCGGDEELIRMIFVDNPRKLWQYDSSD